MSDPTAPYRAWLRQHGYELDSTRFSEPSRIKGREGKRDGVACLTVKHPDGKTTHYQVPGTMLMAYRAACAALPCGFPPDPSTSMPSPQVPEMPKLF